MDRSTQTIISALKAELQQTLEALGNFPKKDPFEHGQSVGVYYGIKRSLDVIDGVLEDQTRSDADL